MTERQEPDALHSQTNNRGDLSLPVDGGRQRIVGALRCKRTMTTNPPIVDQAEDLVRGLATELTRVRAGECLCCYVWRWLDEFPGDGTHRHAFR